MSKLTSIFFVASWLLLPGIAAAHPGHGPELNLRHQFTDPYHLAQGAALAVGVAILCMIARRIHARMQTPARHG